MRISDVNRISIFSKIAIMLLFSIAAVVLPLLYTMNSVLRKETITTLHETMHGNLNTIEEKLNGYQESLSGLLWQTTRRADFAKAVAEKDMPALKEILKSVQDYSAADMVTLSDEKGDVIMRGHADKKGDSVARQLNVRRSLEGAPLTVGYEGGTAVAFSLRGGAPIYYGGKLVGVMTPGNRRYPRSGRRQGGTLVPPRRYSAKRGNSFSVASGKQAYGQSGDHALQYRRLQKPDERHP